MSNSATRPAPARPASPRTPLAAGVPSPRTPPAPPTRLVAGGVHSSVAALVATVLVWLALVGLIVRHLYLARPPAASVAVLALWLVVSTVLTGATVAHLLARLGASRRFALHRDADLSDARAVVAERCPSLTVLVPSYREETEVIRRTLLSASLLEYPDLRVVLLLDDPPHPEPGSGEWHLLHRARLVAGEVDSQLRRVRDGLAVARALSSPGAPGAPAPAELEALVGALRFAAGCLRRWAERWAAGDHGDRLFADEVLLRLADGFDAEAGRVSSEGADRQQCDALHRRLADTFTAELSTFERKRYANLSHEPNKAMNLNAYLSLMGGTYSVLPGEEGARLVRTEGPHHLAVPDPDFVITLDADSVLRPDYALRLVHVLELPANEWVAVAQTPYSAFPGPPGRLERIAGATTDIQYLLHQGMTRFGATFWVGANAVLRKRALDEIATHTLEDGYLVTRYIQDRTVIEDTESSIDLLVRGWSLLNHPERMAFSATPPDFGSLVIQRRRWANGGLIILPRLVDLLTERARRAERTHPTGLFLQVHYLTSSPVAAAVLLVGMVLPAGPLEGVVPPWLIPLLAIGYLAVYAADLRRNGYRAADLFWVYSLNMLLVAVNLAGGLRSLQQAATGAKAPFLRTPKISDRVAAPPLYLLAPVAIAVAGSVRFVVALTIEPSWLSAFAGIPALLCLAGLAGLVGVRAAAQDVGVGVRERLRAGSRVRRAVGLRVQAGQFEGLDR